MELMTDGGFLPEAKTLSLMEEAAGLCLSDLGLSPDFIEIDLRFVDHDEMQQLNKSYRGIDKVTDVLSFPQYEDPSQIPQGVPCLLGDVVICTDKAEAQAVEYGHSRERELVFLFVHSMFHLLGFDHMEPEDEALMRSREELVMERMGLARRD